MRTKFHRRSSGIRQNQPKVHITSMARIPEFAGKFHRNSSRIHSNDKNVGRQRGDVGYVLSVAGGLLEDHRNSSSAAGTVIAGVDRSSPAHLMKLASRGVRPYNCLRNGRHNRRQSAEEPGGTANAVHRSRGRWHAGNRLERDETSVGVEGGLPEAPEMSWGAGSGVFIHPAADHARVKERRGSRRIWPPKQWKKMGKSSAMAAGWKSEEGGFVRRSSERVETRQCREQLSSEGERVMETCEAKSLRGR